MATPLHLAVQKLEPGEQTALADVAALEREAFPEDAQTAANLALMARAGDVWVARDEGAGIVGEAIVLGGVGESCAFLFSLAVKPAWRRRGVGLSLMRILLDSLVARGVRRLELTVDPANEAALGLYIGKLGCDAVELLPDHFGPGRHRRLLRKILVPKEP